MSEVLHFSYKSIGNFVKLLATICWEKTSSPRDITLWHQRFDNEASDELFEKFCEDCFPEGKTLDVPDIELIAEHAGEFLTKDPEAINNAIAYDKRHIDSWVYFKPDKKLVETPFGYHTSTVRDFLEDFFKDFDEVDGDYLERFIIENFEIRSDNLTVEMIARDCKRFSYLLNHRLAKRKGGGE